MWNKPAQHIVVIAPAQLDVVVQRLSEVQNSFLTDAKLILHSVDGPRRRGASA